MKLCKLVSFNILLYFNDLLNGFLYMSLDIQCYMSVSVLTYYRLLGEKNPVECREKALVEQEVADPSCAPVTW